MRLDRDLRDSDLVEPVGHLAAVDFLAGALAAVDRTPFSEFRPEVVAVPEAPVEDLRQPFLEPRGQLGSIGPLADGVRGLAVAARASPHIFGAPGAALYLEHLDARFDELVHELDGTEVFRGHDVFVVHDQFLAAFQVGHRVAAAADLQAGSPVGRGAEPVQAEVAFPGNGHAESAVREHFDAYPFSGRSPQVLGDNLPVDLGDLLQRKLPRQHDDIGPLGVELQGLIIGNAQLGGNVYFHADPAAVENRCHVGSDDRIHTGSLRQIEHMASVGEVFAVQDDVECHVGTDPVLPTDPDDFRQILRAEIVGGMGPHVEAADPEVDGVGTSLYRGMQAFEIARWRHDFEFFLFHGIVPFRAGCPGPQGVRRTIGCVRQGCRRNGAASPGGHRCRSATHSPWPLRSAG